MKPQLKRRAIDNIKFSIGTKLILIITIIVLVSLGSITALVSWLVRQDLQIAAESTNFEVNSRTAMEAEYTFAKTRSEAAIFIQGINSVGTESAQAVDMANYFFRQNPQAAALVFTVPGKKDQLLVNERFFRTQELDPALSKSWLVNREDALERGVTGENLLFNEAPHFSFPLLSLFFAWQKGGGGILFAPENLNKSLSFGTNQSCLINTSGDILIHSDPELVQAGVNVAGWDFIQKIQERAERNTKQDLTIADFRFGRETVNPVEKGLIQQKWESFKRKARPYIRAVSERLPDWAKIIKPDAGTEKGETYYVAYTRLSIGACVMITSIEYNTVFEGIDATTRRNIYLTAGVLFISIMFIWFFSKSISRPLKTLASAARAIEGGIFEQKLQPRKGRDEIGVLTNSFQKMCTALGVFGRFTNREIAVKAMRGQIKPGGLPKHATVFFSDIRSFTAKSETFTKEFGSDASNRIVQWLNDYLTQMVDCVEKTNGVVDKFIGDAVMAHWGTAYTAGSAKKDAYNCVKAALMMRMALLKLNKKRRADDPGDPYIQIGCGINTGIVTAGQIGSDLRMEYTVIGDPVNLASRTEALNKPLGTDILITEDTWNLVKDYFVTEEMPSVTVKGKEKPVRIFAVINFAGLGKGPQNLAGVRILLGIEPPDLSNVDVDADEKKYKIGAEG